MKKVLVTGGAGMLGSAVVKELITKDYIPRIMSRKPEPSQMLPGTEWAQADLATGQNIDAAVRDINVIVHAASNFIHPEQTDSIGTKRLLEAARHVGVEHIIYISIVGIDRMPFSYYQKKLAAEEFIEKSGIPWSILRATQFHVLIDLLLNLATKPPLLALLPTAFKFQSIDMDVVADRLCEIVATGPCGRLPDMGGPEVLTLREMARTWFAVRGMRRALLPLWIPGQVAYGFQHAYNTCPDKALRDSLTWREWVQRKYQSEAKTR